VARAPGDWQLSWSLAQALEAVGRHAEAADHIERHLARWPQQPGEGWRALGRCEYRAGRAADAMPALERALAADPRDAEAQLYMGLSLQHLGRSERAERHFETSAELDPRYAGEGLLLSGMSRIARGDAEGGRHRLRQVLERAPRSASARDARRLLDEPDSDRRVFGFEASSGVSYDSNVTLESGGGDVPGSRKQDALFDFGTELSFRPLFGESQPVELGLAYQRLDYASSQDFASQGLQGSLSGQLPLGGRAALRLDSAVGYTLLDDEPYLLSAALRPSLFYALGRRSGVLRLHAGGERLEYDDAPLSESLDRSGWSFGGGAEHLLPLGKERTGWLAWGGSYQRRETEATRDDLGFRSAYDGDRYRASLRGSLGLPFQIRARADLYFDYERYAHRNVIAQLSEDSDPARRRRDQSWSGSLSLRRPLYPGIDLEIHANYIDRASNVDLYGYERAITGVRLHAALP
jgi:tetratricopeptide (TPR) repeat protein